MKKILIIGATSAIAESTARLWAHEGHRLYLLARHEERLHMLGKDLRIRGAESTHYSVLDVNDFSRHQEVINSAIARLGGLDIVLIAHGTLGNQKACEQDFQLTLQELNTNVISVISLLTHLANYFERQQHGTIAVISSVAGDRGRQSNYVYGTAKGAVSIFLQGLRNRLHHSGVQVLTIKPGFVDTPMTAQFRKGMLWASPEAIATRIVKSVSTGANVIYAPGFWLAIMLLITSLPEPFFKRLKL